MKFFMPSATSDEEAESVYREMCALAVFETAYEAQPERVYSLKFTRKGHIVTACVGEPISEDGPKTLAVIEVLDANQRRVFLIYTAEHIRTNNAEPIEVRDEAVKAIQYFDHIHPARPGA
jgi:hypothetical protein